MKAQLGHNRPPRQPGTKDATLTFSPPVYKPAPGHGRHTLYSSQTSNITMSSYNPRRGRGGRSRGRGNPRYRPYGRSQAEPRTNIPSLMEEPALPTTVNLDRPETVWEKRLKRNEEALKSAEKWQDLVKDKPDEWFLACNKDLKQLPDYKKVQSALEEAIKNAQELLKTLILNHLEKQIEEAKDIIQDLKTRAEHQGPSTMADLEDATVGSSYEDQSSNTFQTLFKAMEKTFIKKMEKMLDSAKETETPDAADKGSKE